jgi:ribose transport system ATP-binding protein
MEDGLVIRNLSKVFPGQVALTGVALDVRAGEVHALVGQNGSGKSTLIKILAGLYQPDPGAEAWVNETPFHLGSVTAAHEAGLRFIHQDLGLVPTFDVVDNLALGQRYHSRWWLSDAREALAARALLAEIDVDVDVSRPLSQLSAAECTAVAIARALRGGVSHRGLLIFDEPTASLPAADVERLFRLIRTVKAQGTAVLYVTHRMSEVFEIADRVTVLRDGQRVLTAPVSEVDHAMLVEHIVGRPLDEFYPEAPTPRTNVALEARSLRTRRLHRLSFSAFQGEILGFAGITGSGREEVASALFGATPWLGGELAINETVVDRLDPASAIRLGVAYLPSDRKRESAIPAFNVRENLTLPKLKTQRGHWLGIRPERNETRSWLERLHVRPVEPDRLFSILSGGNQQKVVLARWLRCDAKVLVLDEPTQGVDVGAKSMIYETLSAAAQQGTAVIVASSDAEELARICDRVIVLCDGEVRAELFGSQLSEDAITRHALAGSVAA